MLGFKITRRKCVILVLIFGVVILYWPSVFGFFQHDEWGAFAGLVTLRNEGVVSTLRYLFWPNVSHYVPLSQFAFYLEFVLFRLNFALYVLVSLVGHLTTVFLVYILSTKLFKSSRMGFYSSLFFLFSSAGYQAVTWMAASLNTQMASIFALLSCLYYLKSREKEVKKNLIICFIFYFFSVCSKEIAVLLPVVFFVYALISGDRKRMVRIGHLFLLLSPIIAYMILRLSFFLLPTGLGSQYIVTRTQSFVEIIYNFVSFPFKVLSQSIVPARWVIYISQTIGNFFGIRNESVIETTVSEIASYFVCAIILYISLRAFKKLSGSMRKIVFVGFFFVLINSFIYAFSPGRVGIITFPDSRNLYFPLVGVSIILTIIFFYFRSVNSKISYLLLILFLVVNAVNFYVEFKNIVETGTVRREILSVIIKENVSLPKKTVFYIESDKSYYGMPGSEKIPPFETGLGQILLVAYNDRIHYPNSFFENNFLYGILDQGYMEVNGIGFGYFRNFTDLEIAYRKGEFSFASVIGYHYNSNTNKLVKITDEVKAKMF